MQRKRTSYAATSATQVENKNNAFHSQQSGVKENGKAAACGHYVWRAKLNCHGYRHHPEHTGKRLALFPLISKRSFYVTLSSPTCLVGFGGVCLRTLTKQSGEPIVVCSPTLKALIRAFCAMRFSRQSPVASTGARALKKHGTGCLWTLMDCYCCVSTSALSVYVYGLLLRKNSIIV